MRCIWVFVALFALTTAANADVIAERAKARAHCRQEARAMSYVPNTQKWKKSIKACMIDRGFNGR
jgi:hypothetical protein